MSIRVQTASTPAKRDVRRFVAEIERFSGYGDAMPTRPA
jgi:hypothetical protein